jgi:hypothetical protein
MKILIKFLLLSLVLQGTVKTVAALSTSSSGSGTTGGPSKVLVTGASGKTGRLVFETLLENPNYVPTALVRSETSGKMLRKAVRKTGLDQIVVCDVTDLVTSKEDDSTGTSTTTSTSIPSALVNGGYEAMVICTSAMPRISKLSLVKALLKVPWNLIRRKKAIDFRSLKFVWKKGQYPEKVSKQTQYY